MEDTRVVGSYVIGAVIGQGSFGKVRLGRHMSTGHTYAVKVIQKAEVSDGTLEKVAREIKILRMLSHPHVVRTHDVFNTPRHIYIVMEYVPGGELFQYILVRKRVAEREAKKFFGQIIMGISYCHRHNIIHRDLKPENLLLDSNRNIKMIDFGLSVMIQPGTKLMMKCGSPHYSAPEMSTGEGYGPEVDVFSAGVILFALICGFLPFDNPVISQIPRDMMSGDYHVPSFISADAADLLHRMLRPDPKKRITIEGVMVHPWLGPEHLVLSRNIAPSAPPPPPVQVQARRRAIEPLPTTLNRAINRVITSTNDDTDTSDDRTSVSSDMSDVRATLAGMGLGAPPDDAPSPAPERRIRPARAPPTLSSIPENRGVPPVALFRANPGKVAGVGDLASPQQRTHVPIDHGETLVPNQSIETEETEEEGDREPALVESPRGSYDEADEQSIPHRPVAAGDAEPDEDEDGVPRPAVPRFTSLQVGQEEESAPRAGAVAVVPEQADEEEEEEDSVLVSQRFASFFTTTRSVLDPTPRDGWFQDAAGAGGGGDGSAPRYQPGDSRVFLSRNTTLPPRRHCGARGGRARRHGPRVQAALGVEVGLQDAGAGRCTWERAAIHHRGRQARAP